MTEFLTPRQFCDRFQIAKRTADRWRRDGCGPSWFRAGPRKILYPEAECVAWAAARAFAANAAAHQAAPEALARAAA